MSHPPVPSPNIDAAQAQQALADPTTSPGVLVQIAQAHPHLQAAVASHPNVYPDLLHWLDQQGNPVVSGIVAQRRAMPTTAAPPVAVPAETPPDRGSSGRAIWMVVVIGVVLVGLIALLIATPWRPWRRNGGSTPMPGIGSNGGASSDTGQATPTPDVFAPHFSPIVMGGSQKDFFTDIAVASDGSIVAVGYTRSTDGDFPPSHGSDDALIAKFSPDGTLLWARTNGGSGDDEFSSVTIVGEGNIIAAGNSASVDGDFPPGHGQFGDAILVKYDANGTMQWAQNFDRAGGFDRFTSLANDGHDTIIAVGVADSSYGESDGLITAYDLDGKQLWASITGDGHSGVTVADDGSIYAVGVTASDDALVAKYSSGGTLQWAASTGGSGIDHFAGVAIASDGSIVAVGTTMSSDGPFPPSAGATDALIAKFSQGGTMQWAKTGGGTGYDSFNAVAVAADGSVYAVGDSQVNGVNDWPQALIAKYDSAGGVISKLVGGSDADCFNAVALAADGSIIAAGFTASTDGDFPPSNGDWDALLANFDPNFK